MRSILSKKKGQLGIADAPTIVLIVGLIFLIMATLALIGQKYGLALASDTAKGIVNETTAKVGDGITDPGITLASSSLCGSNSFALLHVTNATGASTQEILIANYSIDSDTGYVVYDNSGISDAVGYNNTVALNFSYTVKYGNVGCNVTDDLQTELSNNTSIAGIILTISLVGIVLSVLIGIFVGFRERRV